MRSSAVILYLLIVLMLGACHKSVLPPAEYVEWLKNEANGLHVKKSIGKYEFDLQYKTPEYLVLSTNSTNPTSKAEMENERRKFEALEHYTLRIRSGNNTGILEGSSDEVYAGLLEYFISYAQDDIYMIQENDTVPCVQYHYERTYGLSPDITIVLGFEKRSLPGAGDRAFVFNDHVLGIGPVKFNFDKEVYTQLPALRYEN
jgi:hypothetical protein